MNRTLRVLPVIATAADLLMVQIVVYTLQCPTQSQLCIAITTETDECTYQSKQYKAMPRVPG